MHLARPDRSRNRSSPPRGASTPAASRSSMPAIRPSRDGRTGHGARAAGGCRAVAGYSRERQLEEGVQLDALAAQPGVLEDQAARSRRCRCRRAAGAGSPRRSRRLEHPEVAVAQVTSAVGHARARIPQPVEHDQRVGRAGRLHHLELKVIVEPGIHQLEREPDRAARRRPDPAPAPRAASGESALARRPARPRRASGEKSFSSGSGVRAPGRGEPLGRVAILVVAERLVRAGAGDTSPTARRRSRRDRVRSAAARTRPRYSSNERSQPLPFQVTVQPSAPVGRRGAARPSSGSRASPRHPCDRSPAASSAMTVLSTDEGEARGAVGLELVQVEGELARALADRVRER